jgi:hypothetical protein
MTTVHPPPSVDGVHLAQHRPAPSGRGTVALLAVLTVWATVVASIAAVDGFVADGEGLPWLVIAAVAAPLASFFVAFRRRPVRNYLLAIDPRLVLSIQLWRVIGIAFLFGWALDDLDASFAVPAGVGDVTVGVAAFVALAMLLNGTLSRPRVIALTVLGIGDFVVAVVAGGVIVQPDNLEEFRWVLFPTVAVPFFALAHVVTWAQLVTRGQPRRALSTVR